MPNPLPSLRAQRSNPSPALFDSSGDGLPRRDAPRNNEINKPLTVTRHPSPESGNAFMFILIGIVLFAALAMTVSRGFHSTTTSNLSKREAELAASEIINYVQNIQRAVDRVRRKGCSENEISFENPANTTYTYGTRDKCKVFSPTGGKINYRAPDLNYLDQSFSANSIFGLWRFNGGIPVQNIGTAESELMIKLNHLNIDVCMKINDYFSIPNSGNVPPIEDNTAPIDGGTFIGTFGAPQADIFGDEITEIAGKSTFCRQNTTNAGNYQLNHVLLAR
ncbi:MAG: hypothetical protein ACRBCT_04960 [Alphaproteobacteria bacterium]